MEKRGQVNTILCIALLYTAVTIIFSILGSLIQSLYYSFIQIRNVVYAFFVNNILLIIVAAAIIIISAIKIKKSGQTGCLDILKNQNIRLTTGILVAIHGLINLSATLPQYIIFIQSLSKSNLPGIETSIRITIIDNSISAAIILCQILLGIYLAGYFKKKIDKSILWIALLFTVITSVFSLTGRTASLILFGNGGTGDVVRVFSYNILLIVVAVIIIIILTLKIKKSNQTGDSEISDNQNICLTVGILVVIQGLINLLNPLRSLIIHILTFLKTPGMEVVSRKLIIQFLISAAIILCQISLGIYLTKYHKKKMD